ncbi:cellulose-binding family II protein [Colletotrichum nymphaeae SA-01]|uniref:Cellulose-binding family II protein n=1 Tax=Colletotrichum nymphaeae SA-01 TaxID=1460502 RepID=A0A135TVZ1_9PEZI|nr:cellulose-binding family II protein [Colletotrichum nymphaeae SA-01]
MRFSTTSAAVVALAASSQAMNISTTSDLDGSVWQALAPVQARTFEDMPRNRPIKRQSGWSPPSNIVTPLKEVWDHCKSTYSNFFGFKNYGWDQVIATKGTINVCVRWESSASVTEAQRTQVAKALNTAHQGWYKWLYGYDNFPYTDIKVNVVGWAVRDKSLLQGSTSGIQVYTDKDAEGIPQCAESCGRFFNQNGDYSKCAAGADRHYDQSLWLTDGMNGGAGGDWGQRIGREYFMGALDSASAHILQHEIGHTYGLDDFYDWTPTGVTSFIMLAGSAAQITDFDGWMLRNWWYELSRERGWQSGTSSSGSSGSAGPASTASAKPTAKALSSAPAAAAATTAAAVPTQPANSGATVGAWAQCGGSGYTGATACVSGFQCVKTNEWYSQCLSA